MTTTEAARAAHARGWHDRLPQRDCPDCPAVQPFVPRARGTGYVTRMTRGGYKTRRTTGKR